MARFADRPFLDAVALEANKSSRRAILVVVTFFMHLRRKHCLTPNASQIGLRDRVEQSVGLSNSGLC